MGKNLTLIIGGVLVFVIVLIVSGIINTTAATSGSAANIGSFTGVRSFNDLFPLLFLVAGMIVSLGAMGLGAAGLAGYGPTHRKVE